MFLHEIRVSIAPSLSLLLYILLRDFVIKIHGSRKIIVRTKFPQRPAEITCNVFPSAARVCSAFFYVFRLRLIRDL